MTMKNDTDSLTTEQKDLLVGLLLGDGHLETQTRGRTFRLKVEHSEVQADYVGWLFEKFSGLCDQTSLYQRVRRDGRISVGFVTRASGTFRFFADQFYVGRRKRIPPLIGKLLTPISLSVWFMDDGSRKSNRHQTYNVHTLAYSREDLLLVQQQLWRRYGIRSTLHRQRNNSWRLYIGSDSAKQFAEIVRPYVRTIPSMRKKLVNERNA